MSHQITLNSWFGSDPNLAANKMAKVFRIGLEQGETILEQLQDGRAWKFAQKISDHQAGSAAAYLQSLGFQVDLKSLKSEDEGPMDSAFSSDKRTVETSEAESDIHIPFTFMGNGGELFGILFSNWLKTVLTLGIYHFWAKTKVREYFWSNTSLAKDRFSYRGTGKESFRGFLKFSAMVIGLVALMGVLQVYGGPGGDAVASLASILVFVLFPILMVKAWSYRLSRTALRGIRFSFRGKGKDAVMIYLKGAILTAITLGLYWPYFRMEADEFWRGNSYFGNMLFKFTGDAKDIFWNYVLAVFLTIITFGIFWIWFHAYLKRYSWSKTQFGKATFRFTASGWEWFVLYLVNGLLLIFTLGLAYSWVAVRNQNFFAEHLTLDGKINLDSVIQDMKTSGALGEEALDVFDIPVDIG